MTVFITMTNKAENFPDIEVRWTWENEKSYLKSFPETHSRSWGYIDCPEELSMGGKNDNLEVEVFPVE